jgi:hypothetical protein
MAAVAVDLEPQPVAVVAELAGILVMAVTPQDRTLHQLPQRQAVAGVVLASLLTTLTVAVAAVWAC